MIILKTSEQLFPHYRKKNVLKTTDLASFQNRTKYSRDTHSSGITQYIAIKMSVHWKSEYIPGNHKYITRQIKISVHVAFCKLKIYKLSTKQWAKDASGFEQFMVIVAVMWRMFTNYYSGLSSINKRSYILIFEQLLKKSGVLL